MASERSECDTTRGVRIPAGVIYIIYTWMYMWHNSSACHTYAMWAELGHSHLLLGNHIVGRGTCQPFKKCCNHLKRELKMFLKRKNAR